MSGAVREREGARRCEQIGVRMRSGTKAEKIGAAPMIKALRPRVSLTGTIFPHEQC
jgi:hypothetical protein